MPKWTNLYQLNFQILFLSFWNYKLFKLSKIEAAIINFESNMKQSYTMLQIKWLTNMLVHAFLLTRKKLMTDVWRYSAFQLLKVVFARETFSLEWKEVLLKKVVFARETFARDWKEVLLKKIGYFTLNLMEPFFRRKTKLINSCSPKSFDDVVLVLSFQCKIVRLRLYWPVSFVIIVSILIPPFHGIFRDSLLIDLMLLGPEGGIVADSYGELSCLGRKRTIVGLWFSFHSILVWACIFCRFSTRVRQFSLLHLSSCL